MVGYILPLQVVEKVFATENGKQLSVGVDYRIDTETPILKEIQCISHGLVGFQCRQICPHDLGYGALENFVVEFFDDCLDLALCGNLRGCLCKNTAETTAAFEKGQNDLPAQGDQFGLALLACVIEVAASVNERALSEVIALLDGANHFPRFVDQVNLSLTNDV